MYCDFTTQNCDYPTHNSGKPAITLLPRDSCPTDSITTLTQQSTADNRCIRVAFATVVFTAISRHLWLLITAIYCDKQRYTAICLAIFFNREAFIKIFRGYFSEFIGNEQFY